MKEIRLRKSDKVTLIDDEDYALISKYRWYCTKERNSYYATGYMIINGIKTETRMHRLILNAPKGMMVDHIDCNGLNNEKNNLRLATHTENARNRRPNKGRKYKGVTQVHEHLYEAKIFCGEVIQLGSYTTAEKAALAYNEGAIKYFGVFARINHVVILPIQYRLMMLHKQ